MVSGSSLHSAMIPTFITKTHIADAIGRILRDGVPRQRRGRSYCLVTEAGHLPPKYTIAVAHQIATDELLHSDEFSGGRESNDFLRRHGFEVVDCACGGSARSGLVAPVLGPPERRKHSGRPRRHSENCRACKVRVAELLQRIYGECVRDHRFGWQAGLAAYEATPIGSVLRDVAQVLEANRGYGISTFVRTDKLAGCDYWVPDPGFIVEFDESQHFTRPRKLALSAYRDRHPLGFSARRWVELCEQYDAKDNDPLYRDEQRAWYDSLRDLVPLVEGLQPTVRLYARDQVWCALDPNSREDRESFSDLIRQGRSFARHPKVEIETAAAPSESTLRAALVFPPVGQRSSDGVPPAGAGAQQPAVPAASAFMREALDFVLFPEGYISASDHRRTESLRQLARDLGAPLLVGAVDRSVDSTGRAWQVLLRFDPDGSRTRLYAKHSTADAVAFERPEWDPSLMLPTFELGGVPTGATLCHDHYLGLLPRHLAQRGVRLWVNPSFDNVTDIKWASILRLRAVEHRFFSLCTLHYDVNRKKPTRSRSPPMARSSGPDKQVPKRRGPCPSVRRPEASTWLTWTWPRPAPRSTGRSSRWPRRRSAPEGQAPQARPRRSTTRATNHSRIIRTDLYRRRLPSPDRPRSSLRGTRAGESNSWIRPYAFKSSTKRGR